MEILLLGIIAFLLVVIWIVTAGTRKENRVLLRSIDMSLDEIRNYQKAAHNRKENNVY